MDINGVGPLEDVITLVPDRKGLEPPSVVCTCGWSFGPNSNLLHLGRQAKNHSIDTGHKMRGKE